jgi:hypothetical protein
MSKKITTEILSRVQELCFEVMAFEFINSENLEKIKNLAHAYLVAAGYNIREVKCDFENNPSIHINQGHVLIEVFENEPERDSYSYNTHRIML